MLQKTREHTRACALNTPHSITTTHTHPAAALPQWQCTLPLGASTPTTRGQKPLFFGGPPPGALTPQKKNTQPKLTLPKPKFSTFRHTSSLPSSRYQSSRRHT